MYFLNTKWDSAERSFTGVIDCRNKSISESHYWEYTMVFSEDFSKIESGWLLVKDAKDKTIQTLAFNDDFDYVLEKNSDDNKPLAERTCDQCSSFIPKNKSIVYCHDCNYL